MANFVLVFWRHEVLLFENIKQALEWEMEQIK